MNFFLEILIAGLIVTGAGLTFIGSLGILKLPDIFMRLHGPTKAGTLGIGLVLLASSIYFTFVIGRFSIEQVLVAAFLIITAPITSHIIAKTALHKKNHLSAKTVFYPEKRKDKRE